MHHCNRMIGLGLRTFAALVVALLLAGGPSVADAELAWGVGWDDGLTARCWLDDRWELALSAGPDDHLTKEEVRSWLLTQPPQQQGSLEVPLDTRQEQGWVRLQLGRRLATHRPLRLVGFVGFTYNWIDFQERVLQLDDLLGDYDSWERDRFTDRWLLSVGLRPAWRPTSYLSLEAAFGLEFVWEHWDEHIDRTYAGIAGGDHLVTDGHGRSFSDFGWEGLSSLQIIFWF